MWEKRGERSEGERLERGVIVQMKHLTPPVFGVQKDQGE